MKEWFANRVLNELCDIPNRPFAKTVPLCHAVGLQKPEYVKILLAQPGIDVNARDDIDGNTKYYFTALHTASSVGNLELIKTLCEDPDIDILAKDAYQKTALHWACHMGSKNDKQVETGNLEIVKYFIDEKNISVTQWDSNNRTPLLYWASKKLSVTQWDSNYRTLLHWASIGGNLEIVKYLICKITGLTEEQIASEDPTQNIEDDKQRVKQHLNIRNAISHTDIRHNTPYGLAKTNEIKNLFKKLGAEYITEQSVRKANSRPNSSGFFDFGVGGNKPRRSKKRKYSVKRTARNNKKQTLNRRSSKYSRM
jgi:hypothetical protein